MEAYVIDPVTLAGIAAVNVARNLAELRKWRR
jgi:hypothetical protein